LEHSVCFRFPQLRSAVEEIEANELALTDAHISDICRCDTGISAQLCVGSALRDVS